MTVAMSSPLLAFSLIRSKRRPRLRLLSREELGRFLLRFLSLFIFRDPSLERTVRPARSLDFKSP